MEPDRTPVDALFAEPRLAALYDLVVDDRDDLDAYVALAAEVGARRVLDVGCGTGTLACRLARGGLTVTGVDPAAASLAVARRKPGADRVRWVCGTAPAVDLPAVDLVTMTGNVAQVFLTDEAWGATLRALRAALVAGGTLVFESRDPARRAWREWTPERTRRHVRLPAGEQVDTWIELTDVRPPFVSFRHTFVFSGPGPGSGAALVSDSTLRFRGLAELEASLAGAGLRVHEVRDAPDRPGREFVVLARPAVDNPATVGRIERSVDTINQ